MPSRYFARTRARKAGASGPVPKPGMEGTAPATTFPGERTAAWPGAGPEGPQPFNRMKWPTVKTAAARKGLPA